MRQEQKDRETNRAPYTVPVLVDAGGINSLTLGDEPINPPEAVDLMGYHPEG